MLKIQGSGWIGKANPYQKQEQTQAKFSQVSKKKDELQISEAGKSMLDELHGNQPAERKEKLAQLKNQIENGTYTIDTEKVAEKLLKWWNL